MVCVVKKNCFCVFSILMFGEEAVCPDGLFVTAIFREVHFYLNSLMFWDTIVLFKKKEWSVSECIFLHVRVLVLFIRTPKVTFI